MRNFLLSLLLPAVELDKSPAVVREVARQVVSIVYRNSVLAHIANALVSLVVAGSVLQLSPSATQLAYCWLAYMLASDVLGGLHSVLMLRQPSVVEDNEKWFQRFRWATIAMAAGWAAAHFLFMPGARFELRLVIIAMTLGMVGGAIPLLLGLDKLIRPFAGIIMLSLSLVLGLWPSSQLDYALSASALLYLATVLLCGAQLQRALMNSMYLGEERRELLEAARAAQEFAEQAKRAKSEFLAIVSHEIRTPMNAMVGYMDVVAADPLAPAVPRHLATMRRAAKALLRVLNDILDIEKLEARRLTLESIPFSLGDVLDEVMATYSIQASAKGLVLELERSADVPEALIGDPLRLTQVLSNLVSNALKFTRDGQIRVGVVAARGNDSTVEIRFSVTDTGIGMSEEQQRRIFDDFSQADSSTSRRFGGTGLGLPICRWLVNLMGGGEISVCSKPGRGSEFEFSISFPCPAVSNKSDKPAEIEERPRNHCSSPRSGPARILVADDVEENRDVLAELLTQKGYVVQKAAGGAQALAAMQEQNFDALLLDMLMPDIDGVGVTQFVRQREASKGLRRTPIVLISASIRDEDRERSRAAGADCYFVKPVDLPVLVAAIERLGGRARP